MVVAERPCDPHCDRSFLGFNVLGASDGGREEIQVHQRGCKRSKPKAAEAATTGTGVTNLLLRAQTVTYCRHPVRDGTSALGSITAH
jgi:hypothetical protein